MTDQLRVLVCGGRDFADADLLRCELSCLSAARVGGKLFIITGGARGADTMAVKFAIHAGHQFRVYPADWKKHGRIAGPIRNQQMLDEGKPDLVLAFPGGAGTADMVRRARNDGFEVREIRYGR